jgi:hypothetical protein
MKIITTFGGPCVYKRAILPDGRKTGRIQDVGQGKEKIKAQLMDSLKTGRDDVESFCDRITKG